MQNNHQYFIDDLNKYTVAIKDGETGETHGTGVIVTDDGLILTCYHVLGDNENGRFYYKDSIDVYFPEADVTKAAYILEEYNNPELDIAFLKLRVGEALPEQTAVAKLDVSILYGDDFASIGFRKALRFEKLSTDGKIRIKTRTTIEEYKQPLPLIQLYSDEIEEGMSGAPVLDLEINRVVGIISHHYSKNKPIEGEVDKKLNFAIPIECVLSGSAAKNELVKKNLRNVFLQLPTELREHLEYTKAKAEEEVLNGISLLIGYIQPTAASVKLDTWNLKDKDILKLSEEKQIKTGKVLQIIEEEFLHDDTSSQNALPYLVIVGSSGMGKTALSKIIASEYAIKYLKYKKRNNIHGDYSSKSDNYLPIFLSLKDSSDDGLTLYDGAKTLDLILNKIDPSNNKETSEEKILLIMDDLDNYKGSPQQLIKIINDYCIRYPKLKATITTRPKDGLPEELKIGTNNYLRLLQFKPEEIDQFFKKYGVKNLDRNELETKLGLPTYLIAQPLFLWMLSHIYSNADKIKTYFHKDLSERAKKCLICIDFFNSIIKRRYAKEYVRLNGKDKEANEKEILRIIAALKHIYGDNLRGDITSLNQEIIKFDPAIDTSVTKNIISSYFNEIPVQGGRKKTIEFTYEMFKEYLLAEYYIQNVLNDRVYRLNTGMPSKETVEFLDGLLEILNTKNNTIRDSLNQLEIDIPRSFYPIDFDNNHNIDIASTINDIINHTKDCINDEKIIFFLSSAVPNEKESMSVWNEKIWDEAAIKDEYYQVLLLHRWICVHILVALGRIKKLTEEKQLRKEKLASLIKYSINLIPNYLRNLSDCDLSSCDLSSCDLSSCDLSNSNLSSSTLIRSNLSGSTFINANLSHAVLTSVNIHPLHRAAHSNIFKKIFKIFPILFHPSLTDMTKADLSYSDLSFAAVSGAKLVEANMSHADLSNAILMGMGNITKIQKKLDSFSLSSVMGVVVSSITFSLFEQGKYADLTKANLSNATLRSTTMIGVDLSSANLSSANLSSANLFYIDLSSADLSLADLSSSTIINCVGYDNLKCDGANFKDASINDPLFLKYLREHNATNTPIGVSKDLEGNIKNLRRTHMKGKGHT
jgi:uncharacterized protein YjbI with pentapeptide repeats